MTRPLTGSLKMAVETILPCHVTSRGTPVFTEASFIFCLSLLRYRQEWLCSSLRGSCRNLGLVFEITHTWKHSHSWPCPSSLYWPATRRYRRTLTSAASAS